MFFEIFKFFLYSMLIVLISKYILVKALRNLAKILNLKPRTIGNVAGIATSIPELLTVTISSFRGLIGTSLYNIISSNIINFVQYIMSLIINKNYNEMKNKGIVLQNILVILTIIIPIMLLKIENIFNMFIVIILVLMYFVFNSFSKGIHEKYLSSEDIKIEEQKELEIENQIKTTNKSENKKIFIYIVFILISGMFLYFVGDALGNVLENLAEIFGIAQWILGFFLGIITSIPELITFFEAQNHYKNTEDRKMLGVIEATNNLLNSNMLNLFIIQAIRNNSILNNTLNMMA